MPSILRDIIVKLGTTSSLRDGEFDWDMVENDVVQIARKLNSLEINKLIKELFAPIESRLDILDL